MHPARPSAEPLPCPACGTPTDPLRARRVLLLEDGYRYLCSEVCREAFLRGERAHESTRPPPAPPRSVPERVREATRPRIDLASASQSTETAGFHAVFRPTPVPIPWAPLAAALGGLILGGFARSHIGVAIGSAALTALSAGLALAYGRPIRREVGLLPWAVGPTGAILAALAGLLARHGSEQAWAGLAGAAFAAMAMVLRSWLDARARQPVGEVVHALTQPLPSRVRVPAKEVSQEMRYEEVPTRRVRTGEEVLHVEGEVVGVDGVVQGGEAWVLSHPGAQTPVKRVAGDPILAGARVTEGAVRLLTTRVGDERALVRVARFGHLGRGAARVVRLAEQVTRWGGMLALLGAVGGLALTGEPGLAGQISAAAAVLIAAPLLSARRSAEAPLVAAAASAAARGVVFPGPRELEDAGRVATCALSTSGTITEGRPEVVEVHVLGDDDEDALLGLAAATEGAAPRHPIGRALRRYAEGRGVRLGTVRRVMLERGRGVTASTRNGEELVLGNRQMLLDHGVSIALADEEASRAEARGHTALFLGLGGRVRAVIALRDDMRVGARAAVQRMFDQRIVVVLISGDSRATVEVLARQLDVNLVKAELLPAERGQEVKRLGESGGLVAAVGQVDDDDDVLAAADVPIILGAAGSPEGERGVALATDDVRDAAAALWMARAARSEALRGVGLAVGLGAIVVTGAALGWIVPAAAALFAVAVDAFALPAGARLLRRIELRVPAR